MHELMQQLRENDPVSRVEHPDFEPFWAITKHEDIKAISQNNAAFISSPRTVLLQQEFEKALIEKFGTRNGVETLIHMDNPKHKKLRNVTRDWFKPRAINKLSVDIETIAKQYVDKMEAMDGKCDFVLILTLILHVCPGGDLRPPFPAFWRHWFNAHSAVHL